MVATETLVGLAGVAIAGAVAYTVISRPGAVAAPLAPIQIAMPEIKMPDIGITMPDIKFPEELKIAGLPEMPTADELKEIFAAPLAGITEKIPSLENIEDAVRSVAGDAYEKAKTDFIDPALDKIPSMEDIEGAVSAGIDKGVDAAKELIPDYLEDPIKYVSEGIGGVLEPTAGIEFPIKAKVLDPIVAPLAGMEAAPSLFWGIGHALRHGIEKAVESWSYAVDTLRPYAATLEAMR